MTLMTLVTLQKGFTAVIYICFVFQAVSIINLLLLTEFQHAGGQQAMQRHTQSTNPFM